MPPAPPSTRVRRALLVLAAWTAVALVAALALVGSQLAAQRPLPRWDYLLGIFQSCWAWALATPLVFRATERFPLERPRLRAVGAHLGLFLLAWLFDTGQAAATLALLGRRGPSFLLGLIGGLMPCVLSYLALLGVGHALRFHRLLVERQVRAAELQAQLLRSQLTALQMQLRPHFLFNALNTVSGLVRTGERQRTLQVVAGLADLLRAVLREGGVQEVPCSRSWSWSSATWRIEQARFEDRLHHPRGGGPGGRRRAGAPAAPAAAGGERRAPRHLRGGGGAGGGARAARGGLAVARGAGLRPGRGGPGGRGAPEGEGGIGLSNTRARLRHLYGEAHDLALRPSGRGHAGPGAHPFRRAQAAGGRMTPAAAERIRTLVVDDERLARQSLRVLLSADPEVELVGECGRPRRRCACSGSAPWTCSSSTCRCPAWTASRCSRPRAAGRRGLRHRLRAARAARLRGARGGLPAQAL